MREVGPSESAARAVTGLTNVVSPNIAWERNSRSLSLTIWNRFAMRLRI
jgi:hypothetical protein